MDIDLFGFKLRVEVIIGILILYFIIWGNILCSCTHVNKGDVKKVVEKFTGKKSKGDGTFPPL
jgi:hypothetical protein